MNNSETEQKIKLAAKKVFQQKGFDAARTRDIAQCANVNLALINYYYKSKEALFEEIMSETIADFRETIVLATNNPQTSIIEKITAIVDNYYTLFQREPELPLFILHEINKSQDFLTNNLNPNGIIKGSFFEKQLLDSGKTRQEIEQILINTISLILCPFSGNTVIKNLCGANEKEYVSIMEHRRKEIPIWISLMFKLK